MLAVFVLMTYRYGDEAGKFTENTLYSVGNVAMTAYNADNLGIKAITKRAAKDAGKAVLHDMQDERAKKQQTDRCDLNGEKHPCPSHEKNQQWNMLCDRLTGSVIYVWKGSNNTVNSG